MAPIVHAYRSGETGLFVNSYLVEGADGVVAVDAPLLLSDGRAFRARLAALTQARVGGLVSSYLVEGAGGVGAVDAPLLLSDGRAFRARLAALRKPLLGVLVT